MHLIATGGSTNVTDNANDESVVAVPTDEQIHDEPDEHISNQLPDEHISEDQPQQHEEEDAEVETEIEAETEPEPEVEAEVEEEEEQEQQHHHHEEQQLQEHEQEQEHDHEEEQGHEDEQLPIDPSSSIALPMETELDQPVEAPVVTDDQPQPTAKSSHDIAEIHREMLNLIPIPQAWSHVRHQSGLFSYPDLPHFNVIRQATFREGRFVCPFCTVDFASKEGIRYHLYNSCTKSPYPKAFFRCLMCGSELADRSSLRTHLARHVRSIDRVEFQKNSFFISRARKMVEQFLLIRSMYHGNLL